MTSSNNLQQRSINTIRFLSADGVQQANSGHPGLPMGTAAIAYTLFTRFLRFNPKNPNWTNRDRFILSGGHGSMLLYSLIFLTGYDLPLEQLRQFRQWGSLTPGHPEYGLTPGVETTTGPLGQGFANGVGMAMAATHLAAEFNRPGFNIIDHYIYAIVTDGDLMEGVTSEAASLAGHLRLGNLIYFYDDNRITIDGSTNLAFTEDRAARFAAYNWQVLHVDDGNDVEALTAAVHQAQADPRPSLIICRTQIGYGLPTRQGTSKAHGEPPGDEELNGAKTNMGWPLEPRFFVPDDVLDHFRAAGTRGTELERKWQGAFIAYKKKFPAEAAEFERRMASHLPEKWDENLTPFDADSKGMATRAASGKVINMLAENMPELMGGSADLAPSNNTWMTNLKAFQAETPEGRNLHFGVREHGMGAAVNGMALYKGLIPYGATFLVFSDYMRPAIRISALSHIPSIWVFTHDSIGVGEDGPTHQPVEHLAALRAIPNLVTIRPGDANEVLEAWKVAIERRNGPTLLALSRQTVPTLDRHIFNPASGLRRGAYVLTDLGDGRPQIILMATGTEISLITQAGYQLAAQGTNVRLVSFPSWELFANQDRVYQDAVLPPDIDLRIAVEAGVQMGWERWIGCRGEFIGMKGFGASAPAGILYENFGISVKSIVLKARELLGQLDDELHV